VPGTTAGAELIRLLKLRHLWHRALIAVGVLWMAAMPLAAGDASLAYQ
jgi:hypothetical protein